MGIAFQIPKHANRLACFNSIMPVFGGFETECLLSWREVAEILSKNI